mgnify:CR=1 FL=1
MLDKIMFGRKNSSPLSALVKPSKHTHFSAFDDHVKQLETVLSLTYEFVQGHLNWSHEKQEFYYDRNVQAQLFNLAELMWKQ